ncbi:MAG: pyridoxamine 5'-phosphate oxidase family protein [Bacteroidetes bacterium]|nr:pyridoxamine 5'-phosphate oxidase family protein [Bacteroidota bacterium]
MRSRAVIQKEEMEKIIAGCNVCYVGMVDANSEPYVLPFNFGFQDGILYLHSAKAGKKIDILKNNNRVCVVFSTDHVLRYVNEEVACSWGMKYRSVLVYGKVEFIEDYDAKVSALEILMKNYSEKPFAFSKPSVDDVLPWKVIIDKMEGRVYGY